MSSTIAIKQMIEFRRKNNLSQEDIARKCDMSFQGFWKIETGQTKTPTPKTVEKLAAAFNVSSLQILGDEKWIV